MMNVSNMTNSELIKHNIDLVKKLLIRQGYDFNKTCNSRAKTDFLISKNNEHFYIKILGYRYNEKTNGNYAYTRKSTFDLEKFKYLFFVLYIENKAHILKIPTNVFINPAVNSPFKNRDYTGLKSLPEYGIVMNKNNIKELLIYEEI